MKSPPLDLKKFNLNQTRSNDQTSRIINWVGQVFDKTDNTKIFARNIKLDYGLTVVQLYTRSETSDFFKRLTHPKQREIERQLAYSKINEALEGYSFRGDVKIFLESLKPREGKFLSIKVDSLSNIGPMLGKFRAVDTDLKRYENAHKSIPPSFNNWQFESSPGLDKFRNLSPADLSLIGASLGDKGAVEGFQSFVIASTTKDKTTKLDQQLILRFITKWSGLNETEKNALLKNPALSDDGKLACLAINALVRKVVVSAGLNITVSDNFGLSSEFANTNDFNKLQKKIIAVFINTSTSVQTGMSLEDELGSFADTLGKVIAAEWEKQPGHENNNYYAMEQQIQTVMRNFLDKHIADHLKKNATDQSITMWKIHSENFIERACSSALHKFYAGNVSVDSKTDNLIVDNNIYKPDVEVGSGGQGSIKMAVSNKKDAIAIKTMKEQSDEPGKKKSLRRISNREISSHKLASKVPSDYVLAFHGAVVNADGIQRMAMEYAPNGDVDKLMEKSQLISLPVMQYLMASMARGIAHIHQNANLIHQDIKPANFVIDASGNIKLTDFGTAMSADSALIKRSQVENPIWLAPECVLIPGLKEISKAVDIWSLGIIFYKLASGTLPFDKVNPGKTTYMLDEFGKNDEILDAAKRFEFLNLDKLVDKNLGALINGMLHPVPSQRPNIEAVLAYFSNLELDEAVLKQTVVDIAQSAK